MIRSPESQPARTPDPVFRHEAARRSSLGSVAAKEPHPRYAGNGSAPESSEVRSYCGTTFNRCFLAVRDAISAFGEVRRSNGCSRSGHPGDEGSMLFLCSPIRSHSGPLQSRRPDLRTFRRLATHDRFGKCPPVRRVIDVAERDNPGQEGTQCLLSTTQPIASRLYRSRRTRPRHPESTGCRLRAIGCSLQKLTISKRRCLSSLRRRARF